MSDGTEARNRPRVFISYSHDSDAHRERVLALSERLLLDRSGTEPRPLGQLKRKARDRAASLAFPDSEGEPAQETATTPAQLWPDPRTDSRSAGTPDCYHRLEEICARGEVPEPDERRALWQAVKRDRPSSFLAWQLANVARWSAPEYLEVDERFTPLRVHVRVREKDETPGERQELPFDTLIEAMTAVFEEHRAPASVIFAPPGGGKSTLLRHFHLNQVRRRTEGERLVFYVQLRDYRPAGPSPGDRDPAQPALAWLESAWRKATGQAPPLAAFPRQGSLTLLLDGLNEIPRGSD